MSSKVLPSVLSLPVAGRQVGVGLSTIFESEKWIHHATFIENLHIAMQRINLCTKWIILIEDCGLK